MFGFDRPQCTLTLSSRRAVWVEDSRDWRGHRRCLSRTVDLPEGLIKPSPVEPNVSDSVLLQARLRALIGRERGGDVPIVLVLPDLCARVSLLGMDALPSRPSEREALIRWRLEQESAFPLAGARVVSQRIPPKTVLAVAIRDTVLRQYEGVCEAVGLSPTQVELTSVRRWSAVADSAPPTEPVAWLSLLDGGVTFFIQQSGWPTFVRTKIRSGSGPESVLHDLAGSLALYAETHPESSPRRLMLLSEEPESVLAQRAAEDLSLEVVQMNGDDLWRQPAHHPSGRINLSSLRRSYMGVARAALVLIALALAGLIAWEIRQAGDIEAQIADAQGALVRVRDQESRVRLQAQTEGTDLSEAALQRLPQEVAFANHVITQRVFSWTRLLSDLEEAVPPRVVIHTIRVDTKSSVIALAGSVLTLQDLTAFIISLEDHRAFKDAVLGEHHVGDTSLVEFSLTVRYDGAVAGG